MSNLTSFNSGELCRVREYNLYNNFLLIILHTCMYIYYLGYTVYNIVDETYICSAHYANLRIFKIALRIIETVNIARAV